MIQYSSILVVDRTAVLNTLKFNLNMHVFKWLAVFASIIVWVNADLKYPEVERDESLFENYHGKLVADPYRSLEDLSSSSVQDFIEKQNNLTIPYLEASPAREEIRNRLSELWSHPKYSVPIQCGSRYYYFANSGLQNQMVLYTQESLSSPSEVFVDPNLLSENGTISLSPRTLGCSKDGNVFAYGLIYSGSDWMTIQFKNVLTGETYPEILRNIYFTDIAWTHDNKGIFYASYPDWDGETGLDNQKVFYHKLGTNQSEDVLAVEFPDHPNWRLGMWFAVSHDGTTLLILPDVSIDGPGLFIYYATIPREITSTFKMLPLVESYGFRYQYVTNEGSIFYFLTANGAPNQRIIGIDLQNPEIGNWTVLIPEKSDKLDWALAVDKDKLVVSYVKDVKSSLEIHNLTTGDLIKNIEIEAGSVQQWTMTGIIALNGNRESSSIYFIVDSFLNPNKIYSVNFTIPDYQAEVFSEASIPGFNASDYVVKQIFYESFDKTIVPMYVVHHKNLKLDGQAPAIMTGYGGFSGIMFPQFIASKLLFMQKFGGVFVSTNIRGGGEYGEAWHNAGRLENKQNGFDDFHAAALYLIANNYTNENALIIEGDSNGGLLIGACLVQRPDIYAAAIPSVGIYDMLRYQYFGIGFGSLPEYGSSEVADQFEYLYKYSPLHNVRIFNTTQYPAVLLRANTEDGVVAPLHSYKFISELQYVIGADPKQTNPLLLLVQSGAGHGLGTPTTILIEEQVNIYSFLIESIGIVFNATVF